MQQARVEAMSNEMISVPRDLIAITEKFISAQADNFPKINKGQRSRALNELSEELRALLAKPADAGISASLSSLPRFDMDQTACEIQDPDGVWVRYDDIAALLQRQGEPVAWMDEDGALHTTLDSAQFSRRPITPLYTRPAEQPATSDKYKAELYDEVWQLARDMGFGNVTDALMKLQGNKTR